MGLFDVLVKNEQARTQGASERICGLSAGISINLTKDDQIKPWILETLWLILQPAVLGFHYIQHETANSMQKKRLHTLQWKRSSRRDHQILPIHVKCSECERM